jgi:hypothetical protein
LFPGRFDGYLDLDPADKALRKAMMWFGLIGVSSHSFRRTVLTQMSNNGTPLRVIQEVSGHRNLEQLQTYIKVRNDQVLWCCHRLVHAFTHARFRKLPIYRSGREANSTTSVTWVWFCTLSLAAGSFWKGSAMYRLPVTPVFKVRCRDSHFWRQPQRLA